MSYDVIAYQVDAEKIKSIWNCKSDAFVTDFLSKYKDEIEELEDDFEGVECKAYLQCIVNGEIIEDDNNFIYGYLYELLCQEFGEIIEHEEFLCHLDEVVGEDNNHIAFISIPGNEDWPEFYSVLFNELEDAKKIFIESEDYADEDYYIDEVNVIFDTAAKNKKDLVFFAY